MSRGKHTFPSAVLVQIIIMRWQVYYLLRYVGTMCSNSSLAGSRMSSNSLPKAVKPVCDVQLTQLPSLVVYVKMQKDLIFKKKFS